MMQLFCWPLQFDGILRRCLEFIFFMEEDHGHQCNINGLLNGLLMEVYGNQVKIKWKSVKFRAFLGHLCILL